MAKEGLRRGLQLASVALVFEGTRWGLSIARVDGLWRPWPGVDELIAGITTGSMLVLNGGERKLYYLKRGFILGGGLGIMLAFVRYTFTKLGDSHGRENDNT